MKKWTPKRLRAKGKEPRTSAAGSSSNLNSATAPGPLLPVPEPESQLQPPAGAPFPSSSSSAVSGVPYGLLLLCRGVEPIVDIVAVHGLNGHRETTWTDQHDVLWLRDLLPSKLPNARIWTWGYDSRTHTKSHRDHLTIKKLYDHGRALVQDLDGERRDDDSYQRPIIFIAHSLGGIVVKSALLHSDRARKGNLEEERSIKLSTYGVIFMGTPHQGGQGVNVGEILLNLAKVRGNTNDSLLKHLEEHSELLQQQNSEFTSISQDFDIKFAYETLPTPLVGGAAKVIVPKWSAVVPGTPDAAEFGISQDHRQMTRFSNSEDQDFRKLSRMLASMVQKAQAKIESNWQSEGRLKQGRQAYKVPFDIRGVPIVGKYVERHWEMQYMEGKLLPKEESKQQRKFVLHGLGGIGKTQLSLAYARKHQNDYTAVFWLNGQARESLKQSIAGIASRLPKDQMSEFATSCTQQGSEQLDKLVEEVLGWFSREGNGKWLLIYDNVDRDSSDDPEAFDIADFLPGSDHGAIIITTRQLRLRTLGDEMSVTKMTMEEGLKVLENQSGSTLIDNPQASELVNRVEGLPLALAQAASYMRETGTSVTEYLDFYNTAWDDLMNHEARPESVLREYGNRSVQTTWNISFESVKRKNEDAANMLQVWSYLDNRDIWFELFNNKENSDLKGWSSPPEWFRRVVRNKLSFKRVAGTLLAYSLIEARQDSDSYGVHPVVHEWCRKTVTTDRQHESAFLAITSVAFGVPDRYERDYWRTQRRLLPHANRFSQQSMDMLEEALEPEQVNELHTAFHFLGDLYSDRRIRMRVEAEALYNRAMSGREKSLGSHHRNTIHTLSRIGSLYHCQGRLVDAEDLHRRVLAKRTEELGPDHKTTMISVYNLAVDLQDQNKLVEAEDLYQRVLTWHQKAPHPTHTIDPDLYSALGFLYHIQGKLAESEAKFLQALAGYEAALESDHPYRLRANRNLGFLYVDQERLAEAEAAFKGVLEGSKKVFGPDHEETLDAMYTLGSVFEKQGRLTEAEAIYRQALAGYQTVLGPDHEDTLRTLNNLRECYEGQGKFAEATPLYLQELELYRPDTRKDEKSLGLLNNLGYLYAKQGRSAEAEVIYQQALTGYQTVLGPDHEDTLRTLNNLRECYEDQGKFAEATPLYLQELELYGPDARKDEKILDLSNDLGVLYHRQHKFVEAEAMYQQALNGYQTMLGPDHEDTLRTLNNLRECYEDHGKFAEATPLYLQELELYGPDARKNEKSLNLLKSLGVLYYRQYKFVEAEAMLQQALRGYQTMLGPDHKSTLRTLRCLRKNYKKQCKLAEAEALSQEGLT